MAHRKPGNMDLKSIIFSKFSNFKNLDKNETQVVDDTLEEIRVDINPVDTKIMKKSVHKNMILKNCIKFGEDVFELEYFFF